MPLELDTIIPCSAVSLLPTQGGVLLSTAPKEGEGAQGRALFIQAYPDQVFVTSHGQFLTALPRTAVASPSCDRIHFWSAPWEVGVEFTGLSSDVGNTKVVVKPHYRPEFHGVFTDIRGHLDTPPTLHAVMDTRFAVTATPVKLWSAILSVIFLAAALFLTYRLSRRFFSQRVVPSTQEFSAFSSETTLRTSDTSVARIGRGLLDGLVLACLVSWNWLGAMSADDGYLITLARSAHQSGYLSNYYRYFGAVEAPFDWYERILSFAVSFTHHGVYLRLFSVFIGFALWIVISRRVLPIVGSTIAQHPLSRLTSAAVLLAFWLPYCSGLRPEALIALGTLLTWCCTEKALSHDGHTPLYASLATVCAAFTQALAPQGIAATAVLLASVPAIAHRLRSESSPHRTGILRGFRISDLALIAASGLVVLSVVFSQQTIAGVVESLRLRYAVDGTAGWNEEFLRWNALLAYSPEGSIARRWPMLLVLISLGLVVVALSRRTISGVHRFPLWRLVSATFLTMLLLSFVPYKWPEHFGVFAGFGAVLAAAATALAAHYSRRSLYVAALVWSSAFFLIAWSTAGKNGWFWVQGFSLPAYFARPYVGSHALNSILLIFFLLFAALAGYLYLRRDYVSNKPRSTDTSHSSIRSLWAALVEGPLLWITVALLVVHFSIFSFAAAHRFPAYSVLSGNIHAVTGGCEMADAILAEPDVNAGLLQPAEGISPQAALGAVQSVGFSAKGLPEETPAIGDGTPPGILHVNHSGPDPVSIESQEAGTNAGLYPLTRTIELPFGLRPGTPVLGSYGYNTGKAELISGWYELGPLTPDTPVVALSAAGHIMSTYLDGTPIYGQSVQLEFGSRNAAGITSTGAFAPLDPVDPTTSFPWRTLRLPVSDIPAGSTLVRIVVEDNNLQPDQWVAVTPPRVPHVVTLHNLIGSSDPVLLDFAVASQFPCQRPFTLRDGVTELPSWRILPSHRLAGTASFSWLNDPGGGPLAAVEALLSPTTVPTYFRDDWQRDWGSLQRYTLIPAGAVPAHITTGTQPRSGWWRPGPSQPLELP